jgi:predicted secreted protein
MSVSFAIAIYVVIWWTVLFAILPIGVRTQGEEGAIVPGTPASAPAHPRLLRVVLLTTLVSAVVFIGLWLAVRFGLIDLQHLLGRPSVL